jgi:hypothetical protein
MILISLYTINITIKGFNFNNCEVKMSQRKYLLNIKKFIQTLIRKYIGLKVILKIYFFEIKLNHRS